MTKKNKPLVSTEEEVSVEHSSISSSPETNQSPKSGKGLNRRNFLGLSMAGAVAPLITTPLSAAAPNEAEIPEEHAASSSPPLATPASAPETWDEPWVWKPGKWPGETLHMNVVEHQTPSSVVGLGNPNAALMSYNGATPGPTIRMRGDETLKVKLFNHLGLNRGTTVIGEAPDPGYFIKDSNGKKLGYKKSDFTFKKDWELGEHLNGIHAIHTTNMHTHGLHVRPGLNIDGTHSDNIYLRVIPPEDLEKREKDKNYDGDFLLEGEQAGEAHFEFRLGQNNGKRIATHPPGTHWYHPHSHGSTNMEVASGMAGFLVIEGNVDDAINKYMTGIKDPDTTIKTGAYGYRERLMMLQRVLNPPVDQDSQRPRLKTGATPATNGSPNTDTIVMRPGDVERWRVLNGSVDGKGYVRFMVLEGQWVNETPPAKAKFLGGKKRPTALPKIVNQLNSTQQLLYVDARGERCLPSTADIEARKQQLYLLAQDGVTLVRKKGTDSAEYYLKDLKNDTKNPLYQDYSNLDVCYQNAENLKACYNLSNELYMAPANRADFIFQAPQLSSGETTKVYTVIAKGTAIHTENEERSLNMYNKYSDNKGNPDSFLGGSLSVPGDTIMAYIVVKSCNSATVTNCSQPVPTKQPKIPFSFRDLSQVISEVPVPKYLYPISSGEVQIKIGDRDGKTGNVGKYRTRKVTYSGWGAATWPNLYPEDVTKLKPDGPDPAPNPKMFYEPGRYNIPMEPGRTKVMLPPATRTMAIDGKKFNPDDHMAPRPLLSTAEEWVIYNNSISLFAEFPEIPAKTNMTDNEKAFYVDHRDGHPVTRAKAKEKGFNITTRGIDHPFHIHTNPFWLMRVEVPDENGNLVNVLPEPRWHDVMWIPRNGGRLVFRSRFPDFVGKMVNHCHILQHEDNGMMQEVMITQSLKNANYVPATKLSNDSMSADQVTSLGGSYSQASLDDAYRMCTRVIDDNHMDSPDLPLAYEYPARNGVFNPPPLD
jgi:FtsP/CotA-like multicopper oxidase with cupredoxin domain